jgi:probable HAF family extracellular repeat protein
MKQTQLTTANLNNTQRRGACHVLASAVCGVLWLAWLQPAAADQPGHPQYTVTDLGPIPGKPRVEAYWNGLNNRGQVTGYGYSARLVDEVAFVWDGELEILPSFANAVFSRGHSLNNRGQIVGEIAFHLNDRRATLWDGGTILDLGGLPGYGVNVAFAINNRGQVVGLSRLNATSPLDPWIRHKGMVTPLPKLPGAVDGFAIHINQHGRVVGYSGSGGVIGFPPPSMTITRAVLWDNGSIIDLGTLGGATSQAFSINNRDQIAGWASLPDGVSHAALWDHGTVIDLGTLGGPNSLARSLNNRGQVVGFAFTADNSQHAFRWEDGVMLDLNDHIAPDSGWVLMQATAINARGQIAGFGSHEGAVRAFLLTPVDDDREEDN